MVVRHDRGALFSVFEAEEDIGYAIEVTSDGVE
jgi:hypothetical protein